MIRRVDAAVGAQRALKAIQHQERSGPAQLAQQLFDLLAVGQVGNLSHGKVF